jgi:hypothetical protein
MLVTAIVLSPLVALVILVLVMLKTIERRAGAPPRSPAPSAAAPEGPG